MERHLVLFDIGSADELSSRLQEEAGRLGVRFAAPRPLRPGDRWTAHGASEGLTAVWHWAGSAAALRQNARRLLNEFAYPLAHSAGPSCVAFSCGADALEPRPLSVRSRRHLDLEDIGALLRGPVARGAPGGERTAEPLPGAQGATAHGLDLEAAVDGLDPDQRAAALHASGPARVLAAAGSGKTKTMVARIGALVARGVAPPSILVLAFNTEAAVQLEERLAGAGVPTTRRIAVDADGVHCATFNAFGYRFQRQVLGHAPEVDTSDALQERLLRRAAAPAAQTGSRDAITAPVDPYDARATDEAHALDRSLTRWRAELRPPEPAAEHRLEDYSRLQAERGVQTFDDQIIATVTALLADPSARRLVQERYHFVLVDEFQDVNPAQVALLDILSRPRRNLFVVGDDDQLIYGWRSAHVSNIVDFGHDLPSVPFAARFTLPTNYRCSREVVSRAEQLVICNRRRAEKTMQARPRAPQGAVLFAAASGTDERFTDLAAFLAVEHARLGCDWRDLAVLCRFRSQLTPVARALASWGVPPGPAGPADRLDTAPAQWFGRRLRDLAGDEPAGRKSAPAVEAVVAHLARDDAGGSADILRVADTARLLAAGHPRLDDFLEAWRPHEESPDEERHGVDGVTLATIHATKGREYHGVAVVDFAPSLEPLGDDEREEERRVLYVALTRARERALLTVDLGRGEPHPYLAELARPADRRELTAARRSVRDLGRRLRSGAPTLPAPLRALLDGTAADASRGGDARWSGSRGPQPSDDGAARRPLLTDAVRGSRMGREAAVVAADYLAARSALVERRVFARRSLAATITHWARSS